MDGNARNGEAWNDRMATTVLVVDDSVTMVLSLKTTLALNGFQVETAGNGQEALGKLQAGLRPNLILTDAANRQRGERLRHCRTLSPVSNRSASLRDPRSAPARWDSTQASRVSARSNPGDPFP